MFYSKAAMLYNRITLIKINLKELIIFEAAIGLILLLFIYDLLPKNYNNFNSICTQAWSNDQKQYEKCMYPYHKQLELSKKFVFLFGAIFVAAPIYFSTHKKP